MLGGTLSGVAHAAQRPLQSSDARNPSVIVVGAGLVGSSIAIHMARKSCTVTVLEAAHPASGQTSLQLL